MDRNTLNDEIEESIAITELSIGVIYIRNFMQLTYRKVSKNHNQMHKFESIKM